jgi:hypothetical protein
LEQEGERMSFEYWRQDPGPGWRAVGADAENPDRPLFHGDNYVRLSKRYREKMIADQELRARWQERRERGEADCPLAFPNLRRAALNQPLFSQEQPEAELFAHLMECQACQRQVELLREAIREGER